VYLLRLLAAYGLWIVKLAGELLLRAFCVTFIPIMMVWTKGGMDYNRLSAGATFELSGVFVRRWPKPPPIAWRRLLPLKWRGSSATESRTVTGEVLPPQQHIGDSGV
jgi:hypothetical protein